MWESPIKQIAGEVHSQVIKQEDELITQISQTIRYEVDKKELIKALEYDRDQYEKGYLDAKTEMLDKVKQAREDIENEIKMYSDSCLTDNQKVSAITVRRAKVNSYKHCLEILDKLIESEGIND